MNLSQCGNWRSAKRRFGSNRELACRAGRVRSSLNFRHNGAASRTSKWAKTGHCLIGSADATPGLPNRITRDFLERVAVHDPHMPSVPDPDDSARGQASKCPAYSGKCHSSVLGDVGSVHRQIDFGSFLTSGGLELFDKLQEHRQLGNGSSLAKQERVTLGLTEFLAKLADDMKFQLCVSGKSAPEGRHREAIRGHRGYRPVSSSCTALPRTARTGHRERGMPRYVRCHQAPSYRT